MTSSLTAIIAIMTVSRGNGELIRGAASIPASQRARTMTLLKTYMVTSPDGVSMCVVM